MSGVVVKLLLIFILSCVCGGKSQRNYTLPCSLSLSLCVFSPRSPRTASEAAGNGCLGRGRRSQRLSAARRRSLRLGAGNVFPPALRAPSFASLTSRRGRTAERSGSRMSPPLPVSLRSVRPPTFSGFINPPTVGRTAAEHRRATAVYT